jgi:hypothetical protein
VHKLRLFSAASMLLFIPKERKKVFIECHIKLYAVIYDFIGQLSISVAEVREHKAKENSFSPFTISIEIVKTSKKKDVRFSMEEKRGYWSLN